MEPGGIGRAAQGKLTEKGAGRERLGNSKGGAAIVKNI